MNMTLSKRGDYVMRAAISLARAFDSGRARKIREVVADTALPQTFASQILADLVRAGLATSKAGRQGGYRLARHPDSVTVLEVVEAGEGPLRAERCALGDGPCRWEQVCPLHETWAVATAALRDLLAATSLSVLVERDTAIEAGTYSVPPDSHRSHPSVVALADVVQVELSAVEAKAALARVSRRIAGLVAAGDANGRGSGPRRVTRGRRPAGVEASIVPAARPAGAGEDVPYGLLAWRAAGPEYPSGFEGELSVRAVDPERVELRLEGTFSCRAPALLPAAPDLKAEGRATLRAFLRRLAEALEQDVAGRRRSQGDGARAPSR